MPATDSNKGQTERLLAVARANLAPKRIIAGGLAIVFLMCLFPPWRMPVPDYNFTVGIGYAFFLSPPNIIAVIDVGRLVVQILLVVVVAGGVQLALRTKAG